MKRRRFIRTAAVAVVRPGAPARLGVHELLHALLRDIFGSRPKWFQAGGREFRIDCYATRLWLFHDGAAIRQSAQACLDRLRSAVAARTSLDSSGREGDRLRPRQQSAEQAAALAGELLLTEENISSRLGIAS